MPLFPTVLLTIIAAVVMWFCLADASQMDRHTQHGARLLVISAGGLSAWAASTGLGAALGAVIETSTMHAAMLATAVAIAFLAATRVQGHYKN